MMGIIYIVFASVLWGFVHSFLASHSFKHFLRTLVGVPVFSRLYRFSYNVFSLASFFPILLMLVTFPDQQLYSIQSPWVYAMTIVQGLAAFAMIAGVMQTGPLEFAGLAQLSSNYEESPSAHLVVSGLYAYVRHPLYTAGLAFIWFSPEMSLNRLVLWIILTVYIFIGAFFEERKLMKDFGVSYAEYKARTPMLIPSWRRRA